MRAPTLRGEGAVNRQELATALRQAIDTLEGDDRLIVRLRFLEGMTTADIARTLGLEQRPLYRRLERLLRDLRSGLEERGFNAARVEELLGFESSSRSSIWKLG